MPRHAHDGQQRPHQLDRCAPTAASRMSFWQCLCSTERSAWKYCCVMSMLDSSGLTSSIGELLHLPLTSASAENLRRNPVSGCIQLHVLH